MILFRPGKLISVSAMALLWAILFLISGCTEPSVPKGYALIYGIADYSTWDEFHPYYTLSSLNLTDDDARSMAAMLEEKGWEVRLRVDSGSEEGIEAASLGRFKEDITELETLMNDDDRFLFYYSGHGASIPGESDDIEAESGDSSDEWVFLYAEDPDWSRDVWLDHTFNDDALGQQLSLLSARVKIVIMDSCNSGGFIGTEPGVDEIPPDYPENSEGDYQGGSAKSALDAWLSFPDSESTDILASQAIVMAAAGEDEESWESGEHGIFTGLLLETPESGDKNGDGWITVTEAYDYCLEGIDREWNALYTSNYQQFRQYLPHITGTPLDFVLFPAD